ncbi:uncharacterized protein LOC121888551 [Thunnus maccoyii]|uniref:uncharacterized protein LOC121888551 n=1 Tax=Thunnus maccoyii TaxID=8240 RepID=UPI001C4D177B|nr:uncharacterized protein LOC121888551 [Thunnus maccoyii]
MMNETGLRRIPPDQSSGSGHTFGTARHPSIIDPILSKRVCFYKSGDAQFNGLRMVINNRTFKTFDALLDSLSKKVPLPFGVRNITTPRGVHAIYTLDELEDGKSYICSDNRKVKPINLALARKKLPPWYHARPASSRRRTVQQARFFPGKNIHGQEPVVVRTPKRLLVFRNGDPSVKHTVLLQKRTTPTFESILEYISELMQFHVVKLHTPDGRRVDGLPGLILCSGTVVAAGREPFRSANYDAQKSPAPTRLSTNRTGLRRLKALNRKKKSLSYSSKSRNFSPSSERYIVNRIHNSIAESSYDVPSNPTNSIELESSRLLESVAETEGDTCLGDGGEGQGCLMPTEDDIEKSFRVNEDGSMTVEMKVRLTIKEEETVHWTTTLTRSSVANQLNAACLPAPEPEKEICSPNSNSLDLQNSVASIDTINRDKTTDDNDEDPPSLGSGAFSENSNEEDNIKVQTNVASPRRAQTPGHKQIRKKQASLENIKSVTADGIQEGMVGSYSYREQTENRAMTEQYCMVKQTSTRPVPKPRRLGSVDAKTINNRNISTFNSASRTEILQTESGEEEVTETVLHIYEQQTCQDNFLANFYAHEASTSGIYFSRPATSETGQLSSSNEFEPELWRPSTASESISIWRAESMSVTSDLTLPSLKTGAIQATNRQQQFPKSTIGKEKPQQREVNKDKRISPKPKVINKRVHRLMTPGKRRNKTSAEATEKHKKVKTFSSAGFIKRIYGNKSKSAKSMMKLKKRPTQDGDGGVRTKTSQSLDDTIKELNIPSPQKINISETVSPEISRLNVSPIEVKQPRGILERQTSMHQEKKNKNESYDVSESMSLPAFNSSSSVTNEYVENWLEKAHLNPTAVLHVKTENGMFRESEDNHGLIAVAEEEKCCEKLEMQTCQTFTTDPLPENVQGTSIKQRIQSFENKSGPSVEKTTVTQQIAHSHAISTNTDNCNSFAQNKTEEIKPHSIGISSEINPLTNTASTEIPSGSEVENKSRPIKISLQKATPYNTLSMELPPPPSPSPPPAESPVEKPELSNAEHCTVDVPSVASSPLYRLSSVSSQKSDSHPLSISPTSDMAESPTDHTMEMTTSSQTDIPLSLREAQLPKTVKRAPLVSNISLERKMSLRKACLDKYTLCSEATIETSTSSIPINTVADNVQPNDICSTETQHPSKTQPEEAQQSMSELMSSQSCCTSASPTSVTSEEKISSNSISSSETPTPSNHPYIETTPSTPSTQVSSPKPLVKKVKIMSSPSPERNPQTNNFSSELANNSPKLTSLHNHPLDETMSPNIGRRKQETPNSSPSPEIKQKLNKSKQKKPSPYSQTLDMVSPPVRHKSNRKLLSGNLSSDSASESPTKTQRKTPSKSKHHQTQQPVKSTAELDKTSETSDQSDDNKVNETDDLAKAYQDKPMTDTQIMPQPLNIANQPNMKPVLQKICYSIKAIRQITQNKRQSCLEKSNSLPDFSSHVATTFGSSSKALLAFLSVMTLKEGITNLNMEELNVNNVSCAEALKMIDSLREIASIEDSQKLKTSLSDLQRSASKQLLESWRGFQEFSDKCKSRSSTPNYSEKEFSEQDCGIEENVIDEIMGELDIPETLKEELASLSVDIGSESDNEEKTSSRIIEKEESSPDKNSDADILHPTNEAVNVNNETQDEKVNVDVSSIIKRFTDISQLKQSNLEIASQKIKNVSDDLKQVLTDEASKDDNDVAKCPPPDEHNDKQISEERQLHSQESFAKESSEDTQTCKDVVNEENQGAEKQQQGHNEDTSNQEKENMTGTDSCSSEVEEQDTECGQSEESIHTPENELTYDDESGSDDERQKMSSANKDLEQKVSCEESVSEAGQQQSSEEEPEVECEEMKQESRDLSNPETHFEPASADCYVELHASRKGSTSSPNSENQSLSEEEQSEVECEEPSNNDALSDPANPESETGCMGLNASANKSVCNSDVDEPSSSEEEQPEVECDKLSNKDILSNPTNLASQTGCIGLNASADESTYNSDMDEPSPLEEEQPEVECKELKVIVEESLSEPEEEQESTEEEEHLSDQRDHEEQMKKCEELNSWREETEEEKVTSEDEDIYADNTVKGDLSNLIENQDSYIIKDSDSLIEEEKHYSFEVEEDSGNDHSSCEEHIEVEQPKVKDKQISSSTEEELSCYDKGSSSEEEHVNMDRHIKESCAEHQETPAMAKPPEDTNCEKAVENLKHQSEVIISQSVAERVSFLEKVAADTQKRKTVTESSTVTCVSQKNVPLVSHIEELSSESPTSQPALITQSAPQSSLSFSYDCGGVITTEPEGSRVKSIREMFLAKSSTDTQPGQRRFPSPNRSELPELRAQTSASGGYQSQTSSELSSGEDDSSRTPITKGFVRRTIERLYGKKDANIDEVSSERPPSAPKQKKKEQSSIFSPFHMAKTMSELSYFNSTNALDTLTEATRCIAFNAQVGPGDSVPIDKGRWLLNENTLMRKSVSDPVGINKNCPKNEGMCEDTEESTPYSLFSTKSELEETKKSFSKKCTYFSLPHASDSDVCQDDLSTASKGSVNGDSVTGTKDSSEDTATLAERNGTLPGVGISDFKMKDNKVHPLIEVPSDGEVVAVQPGKGQGVVNRRIQEPDVLDLLYNFCGEHCPIL